jgi:hypothetical protein
LAAIINRRILRPMTAAAFVAGVATGALITLIVVEALGFSHVMGWN